jgi:hypothetical protein
MEHFPVAGITSIDGAIESCMRHPTISQRVACLENLIDLFPGNQGFETMIRQMISRMKEITKLQKFKNINWLNNKTGRCAALYYTYKTACAACERWQHAGWCVWRAGELMTVLGALLGQGTRPHSETLALQ